MWAARRCLLVHLLCNIRISCSFVSFVGGLTQAPQISGKEGRKVWKEGLDVESDAVGPAIYGGNVKRHKNGTLIIGKQEEEHSPVQGPVYAGGGYSIMNTAVLAGPESVQALLRTIPEAVNEISTGCATPLHMCAMVQSAQHSTQVLIEAGAKLDEVDTWGYTALQRAATNNLPIAAEALIKAGASHLIPSGSNGRGQNARDLARRLRSFAVLRVFQQWELSQGTALPEGEVQL